ncbi:elongator complex subunit Elp6 [Schizosaccharomyces japonicus yFS275]|uniref:Elongator complex subunit Elp6 n=1 Tax=Schizosaccharomyces japonicus (strain yFS275 / FY16936) TaxID=402676 RepID=B6K6V2_SCHJY|nr:elongator complex subunit Elp6 [Schizosaccharomyces japonicus yFS275]EEB09256.1 elongator complex subunit Elp6 [Schizosaccharomyces japonicus yFS275]
MSNLTHFLPQIPEPDTLTLLTGTRETTCTFLLHHFLANAINEGLEVFFVLFSRTLDEHVIAMRKWGINITKQDNFHYVDGFSTLFAPNARNFKLHATNGKNTIRTVFQPLVDKLQLAKSEGLRVITILEDVDVLLGAKALDTSQLSSAVFELSKLSSRFVLNITVSTSLPQQISFAHQINNLATRCISCRPLPSGTTRRITGLLRLTRGSLYAKHAVDTEDDIEVLYEVMESGAKLVPKGEVSLQI